MVDALSSGGSERMLVGVQLPLLAREYDPWHRWNTNGPRVFLCPSDTAAPAWFPYPQVADTTPQVDHSATQVDDWAPRTDDSAHKNADCPTLVSGSAPKVDDWAPEVADSSPRMDDWMPRVDDSDRHNGGYNDRGAEFRQSKTLSPLVPTDSRGERGPREREGDGNGEQSRKRGKAGR